MARKEQPITCRFFIPDEQGDYRLYEELTPEEQEAFKDKLVERMNRTLNNYYSYHLDEYVALCRSLDEKEATARAAESKELREPYLEELT